MAELIKNPELDVSTGQILPTSIPVAKRVMTVVGLSMKSAKTVNSVEPIVEIRKTLKKRNIVYVDKVHHSISEKAYSQPLLASTNPSEWAIIFGQEGYICTLYRGI